LKKRKITAPVCGIYFVNGPYKKSPEISGL